MPVDFSRLAPDSPAIDAVVYLMGRLYEHDSIPYDERAARTALEGLLADERHGAAWIMEDGGTPMGYAVVTFGYSLEFRGVDAFLDELYIEESHRGQGIARRAIELAEEFCANHGVRALHLEVERGNTGAQAVYRKLGFSDHDRYLLTKWISR
ncbi:MAG: GNAT family N-acetyltransferase [Candidatus Hydrogenedentes bacterium]|nr:GNAT family N-acetyltransferase [Candidatus Hydrogenedentota bacterium]